MSKFPIGAALILICSSIWPLAASAKDQQISHDVPVSDAQVERMAIRVTQVRPTERQTLALLPGTVIPARNARIVAAAPFGGMVSQVHVLPGQAVTKGTPLATISSRELLDAISGASQAEAELQMAEASARRKRALADKNIQSPTLAEEAEAQVAKIKAVLEHHNRAVSIGEIVVGKGGSYTIPAPADGKIVESNVMPGDKVDAMGAAVTLDTSDELWIEAQVPSDLVQRVRPGDHVQVLDGPQGKIVSVGGSLDKLTRSAKMLAAIPADSGLIPGQMVTLSLMQQAETGSLEVPSSAVARINDGHGVFVRSSAGFTLVPVKVNGRSPAAATITGDVSEKAQVAASGLPLLEQMLLGQ